MTATNIHWYLTVCSALFIGYLTYCHKPWMEASNLNLQQAKGVSEVKWLANKWWGWDLNPGILT